jgi:PAS domain-containing protein
LIERYVAEGLARHRVQLQPYNFVHLGRSIRVASLPLPGVGRIRLWRDETPDRGPFEALPSVTPSAGESLFDVIADGVPVAGPDGQLVWVNEPFVRLYRLTGRQASLGAGLERIYPLAWSGQEAGERERFEHGLVDLDEQLRFIGAPFELPLPQDRWVRIVEQRADRGQRYGMHADITVLKRQQRDLAEAERRAREGAALVRQKTALLEATLEHMHQGVMMINADRVVEVCNRRALELLDLPAGLMRSRSRPRFDEVLAYQWQQDEFSRTPDDIQQFVRQGGLLDRPHAYDRQRPDGRVIEVHSTPIVGGGVLRTFTDISERRRSEERIRHLGPARWPDLVAQPRCVAGVEIHEPC